MPEHTETWFEIEYSIHNADDWFETNHKADTLNAIKLKMRELDCKAWDYRVVRKTLTSEVVEIEDRAKWTLLDFFRMYSAPTSTFRHQPKQRRYERARIARLFYAGHHEHSFFC